MGRFGNERAHRFAARAKAPHREAAIAKALMPLTHGYGETPLGQDELDALLPEVGDALDKSITRAAVYDLEQGLQDQLFDELMPAAVDGSLPAR